MKKKILFISPLPPPYYGSAISSEECLKILQNSKEFEIRNIKLNYSKELSDLGKLSFNKITGFFKVKREIKKQIREFKPDMVYFMPALARLGLIRDFLFIREIKKYKIPVLFHIRERVLESDWRKPFFGKIYTKIFSNEKAILLDESFVPDLGNTIHRKSIFILPNAIKNEVSEKDFNKIIIKRKKQKQFNILFLSNMEESKGWPKVLQACKILQEKNIKFKCNFIGGWPSKKEANKFFNYIEENSIRNVFYLGRKTGKEKNAIIENSDVMVFPTEYKPETFGRVNIEAMMFGLPVIANSVAAIPKIIEHKETGYLLRENSPEEIANYLEILYKNPSLRIKMGELGRKKFLNEFEIKDYEKKFLGILKKNI